MDTLALIVIGSWSFVIIFFSFSSLNKYIMPIFGILILGIMFNFSQLKKTLLGLAQSSSLWTAFPSTATSR